MDNYEQKIYVNNSEYFKHWLDNAKFDLDPGWEDYYQLNKALRNGEIEVAKLLLQEGARVNKDFPHTGTCTPLHYAVNLGCPEIIRLLLDKGACINVRNNNSETPLTMAAKMEKYLIADYLLSVDGQKNYSNRENLSHMHIACMRNQMDVVLKLLQRGARINHAVNSKSLHWPGFTPLHFAVQFQCVEIVEFLLNSGADITIADAKKLTPLHYANILRNEIIIDMILSVHQYQFCNPINSEGLSHFHIACTRNNPRVVENFLKHGVDINIKVPVCSMNWIGYRPIHFAIDYECPDVVKLLLSHNALLTTRDACWGMMRSPIYYALRTANKEIIDLLLTRSTVKKVDITRIIEEVSYFHDACMEDDPDTIEDIIDENSKLIYEELDWAGSTFLHFAIKKKSEKTAKIFLKHGANITVKDTRGKTPLHLAFENKLTNIVDMILSMHLNTNENPIDNEGLSHFHISCMRYNLKIIKNFLQNGVDINNSVNNNAVFWPGYTALHFATEFELEDVVQLLLEHGADITAKNSMGSTPLDVAIHSSEAEYNEMLSEITKDRFAIIAAILSSSYTHNIESFDNRGFSLLHTASVIANKDVIKHLLNLYPEEINKPVKWAKSLWNGFTPLHFAVHFVNTEIANLLISRGASISIQNAKGNTPLHTAHSYLKQFAFSIENPELFFTDDNPEGDGGYSHFHIACYSGNLEAVKYFIDRGIDINQPTKLTNDVSDYNGQTPIHLAINKKEIYEEVVKLLLDSGADINAKDVELNTPLHFIKNNADSKAAKILLAQGADINARNMYDETPLYCICYNSEYHQQHYLTEKIEILLKNGADINIENEDGENPFMIIKARLYHCENIIECAAMIMKHIKKLKIINAHISNKNEQIYFILLSKCQARGHYNEKDFTRQCLEELHNLANLYIDKYTSLQSILKKNSNEMALHSQNVTFREIINSNDFTNKFPIYGCLLKLQYKKGFARRPLLEICRISLKLLINFPIPDACLEKILQSLSYEDLKSIASSEENKQILTRAI